MGKTAAGAVWLNAERLSAYDYWQFWRNTDDADVGRFLRLFTDLAVDEIARLERLEGAAINDAKVLLANAATALAHGEDAAAAAAETARRTFAEGGVGEDLPEFAATPEMLDGGIPILDVLTATGLSASKGEARRLIRQGGAKLNNVSVTDEESRVTRADLGSDGVAKLSAGKKRHAIIRAA
jgi:tyrosyl-tRNA synthetase